MADQERPLPKPPKTPFGRQKAGSEEKELDLLADRMAEAAAQGKLGEFLGAELPDSKHARALANMMMGMTGMTGMAGMMPQHDVPPNAELAGAPGLQQTEGTQVPDEVRKAIQDGNVQDLMGLLRQEHQKRTGETLPPQPQPTSPADPLQPEEQETMLRLMEIAQANKVSLDWVVLRALKLYIEEFKRTGRL